MSPTSAADVRGRFGLIFTGFPVVLALGGSVDLPLSASALAPLTGRS